MENFQYCKVLIVQRVCLSGSGHRLIKVLVLSLMLHRDGVSQSELGRLRCQPMHPCVLGLNRDQMLYLSGNNDTNENSVKNEMQIHISGAAPYRWLHVQTLRLASGLFALDVGDPGI